MFDSLRDSLPLAGQAAATLRRHNRAVVLNLIRRQRPVSRAELARSGQLSMPAVMEIVSELMTEGLLCEVGTGPSRGGRRPVLVDLVPEARTAIGIAVGAHVLTAVVTDLNAAVQSRLTIPSDMAYGPQALRVQVNRVLQDLLTTDGTMSRGLVGVGLAVPAPVYSSGTPTFSPPSYVGWGELPIAELVAPNDSVPLLVDNDANAAALGEYLFGAGRNIRTMLYVHVDRGIGGALMINGELFRGADGVAGELGHLQVMPGGEPCGCGQRGCLETVIGHATIARRAALAWAQAGRSAPAEVTIEDVIDAALSGDAVAQALLAETGQYLGTALAMATKLFNPELIVLGGPTARAGALLLHPTLAVMQAQLVQRTAAATAVVIGQLGVDATAIGASALVLGELFAAGGALGG